MRSWMGVLVALGAGLLPLTAGEETPHELAVKQVLKSLDKLTVALSAVKDADTAQAARPELRKAAKDWTDLKAKTALLPPPDKAEKDRLVKEYKGKMDEAIKKYYGEVGRVFSIQAAKEVLMELKPVVVP